MEDVDVHKLPRKELLQLCTDHNIRTAGVKHDDLVRLLEKKLHPPASDPPRVTPKARSQISTESPVSSPKARSQTGTTSPFSLPRARVKSADQKTPLPMPGSTSQGRILSPLVLVDDLSRNNSPEPSPRTPRKDQLLPNPGVVPRNSITTKSNSPPTLRSDLFRKKANTLTAIGKLQTQNRTRPAQQSDGSSVRGRNNAVAAPTSAIRKQAQERRPQQNDQGSSIRNRSSSALDAPKKNIRSSPMVPVKRPGERTLGIKSKGASRKGQTDPNAASSPRASEGEASVTAIAGSHSDLGSRHSFGSVSEITTDTGHHAMWEDSDADDAQSVSSEPASRFTSQIERVHSPRISTGRKLGRVATPVWDSAHGRRSSLDSSVESSAPHGKDSDLSAAHGEESLISSCSPGNDAAFNLVGDAHELEINSFLDAHSTNPEVNAAEVSHQVEQFEQVRTPEISTAGFQENDMDKSEQSIREQDGGTSDNDPSKAAPSTMQKDILSGIDRDEASNSGNPTEEHDVHTSKENVEGEKWFDSTLNLIHDEDSSEEGANSKASMGMNIQLLSERSATCSPSHQESPYNSGAQLPTKNDPSSNNTRCSGKDNNITSTAGSTERVHFNMESAPLPHPDMERSSVTPRSVNRSNSSPTPDNTAELDTAGELDLCAAKSTSPCDELQQNFDIKLRPKHDYNKEGIKRSNLLQDRNEKVPLLQDGRDNDNTQLIRRTFPSSILLWCSQLFSAIFGTRSQN